MKYGFLSEIKKDVEKSLQVRKSLVGLSDLKKGLSSVRRPHDFLKKISDQEGPSIIAEVKFKSPSRGAINLNIKPLDAASGYLKAGATALSILTEEKNFGGSLSYLKSIREAFPESHLLMKDFVIDEYQLYEGLLNGADAILLIMALLEKDKAKAFLKLASSLGLCSLVEVHDESELCDAIEIGAKLIGINNRNLKTMNVCLSTTETLISKVSRDFTCVSESGFENSDQINLMYEKGVKGFLIGSHFMESKDPGLALKNLLKDVKK
jgi:indole-3-glycerol phosphate synthase